MRNAALTRKHVRVLDAVAAAEAAGERPTLIRVAERVRLRPDLLEIVGVDLVARGLLSCRGEFPAHEETHLPGPEFRTTADGQRVLSTVRAPA